MIEVRLFATLREGREKIVFLEPDKFSKAADVLEHLNIPAGEVAILLITGRHSAPGDAVRDKDVLALFPPVGGG
jgi:sulfur carrier protein